jgi:hypothetical protein
MITEAQFQTLASAFQCDVIALKSQCSPEWTVCDECLGIFDGALPSPCPICEDRVTHPTELESEQAFFVTLKHPSLPRPLTLAAYLKAVEDYREHGADFAWLSNSGHAITELNAKELVADHLLTIKRLPIPTVAEWLDAAKDTPVETATAEHRKYVGMVRPSNLMSDAEQLHIFGRIVSAPQADDATMAKIRALNAELRMAAEIPQNGKF